MLQRHRNFRNFRNRRKDSVHRAFGAADMCFFSSVLMGQANAGFRFAVLIRAGRDVKRVDGPRPLHPNGFAQNERFNIGIKHFFLIVGQSFKRGKNRGELIVREGETKLFRARFKRGPS